MKKNSKWLNYNNFSAPAAASQAAAVIGCAAASDTPSEPGSTMLD